MRVVAGDLDVWPMPERPSAVTIGVFDGVHRGHRHVFGLLSDAAERLGGLQTIVVTFDPHPLAVIAPEKAPRILTSIEHRLELFSALGVDEAVVLPFGSLMRDMSPAGFAESVIANGLDARLVAVGEDFRFGRDRTGHVGFLRELGAGHGFETVIVPLVGGDAPVSSTGIRALVATGDVADAAAALDREHEVRGTVVHGDGRGHTIGVPTANLDVDPALALPCRGVYAVRAGVVGEDLVAAVANIGVRPTFGGEAETIEVHLLDADRDLYGTTVRVAFVDRIRDERRFGGVGEVVEQIGRDIATARSLL